MEDRKLLKKGKTIGEDVVEKLDGFILDKQEEFAKDLKEGLFSKF